MLILSYQYKCKHVVLHSAGTITKADGFGKDIVLISWCKIKKNTCEEKHYVPPAVVLKETCRKALNVLDSAIRKCSCYQSH